MQTLTEKETKIQFHLGNPELIQAPSVETCAFNERIQKIVVNADDLMDEQEVAEEKVIGVVDVEQEEERERMRKEEEVHPDELKNQSCL